MKKLILPLLLLISVSVSAKEPLPGSLPDGRGSNYTEKADYTISDEFNSSKLDRSKWNRRSTGGEAIMDHVYDKSLVKMEKDNGVSYVSIKATTAGTSNPVKPRTAGIVSSASGYFGFYVVTFRITGLSPEHIGDKKFTIWHPSVWSAIHCHTGITGHKNVTCENKHHWIEIDFLEWENPFNAWACDAPARLAHSSNPYKEYKVYTRDNDPNRPLEKAILTGPIKHDDGQWETVGLEYTPDYLRVWAWKDGEWHDMNVRDVNFIDMVDPAEKGYSIGTIGRDSAQPCFWVLGNIVIPKEPNKAKNQTKEAFYKYLESRHHGDMSFDIDFFRYYPHKSVEKNNWSMRNGQ